MSKGMLIDYVAGKTGTTKKDAEAAVNAVATGLTNIVAQGNRVTLAGLGTFKIKHHAAKTGRNPRTGETIQIAARDSIGFKPSKAA